MTSHGPLARLHLCSFSVRSLSLLPMRALSASYRPHAHHAKHPLAHPSAHAILSRGGSSGQRARRKRASARGLDRRVRATARACSGARGRRHERAACATARAPRCAVLSRARSQCAVRHTVARVRIPLAPRLRLCHPPRSHSLRGGVCGTPSHPHCTLATLWGMRRSSRP